MTLGQLRTFVVVAETGSVRVAAERLVVSQSAVSAALAALQADLGLRLVEREGRGLRLTYAGEVYADYTRRVLGLLEEAEAAAGEPGRSRLRLAAVTTAGEHVLPQVLATFLHRWSGIEFTLEVGTRARVEELIAAHEADLAVTGRPPAGLLSRAVRPNELVVVGAQPADPTRASWLMREAGSGTRATAEALLDELGLDPPRLTLGSNRAVVAGAAAGLGVTLVSRDAVARELDSGELVVVELEGTPLARPWHAVTHLTSVPAVPLFVEHLKDFGFGPPPEPGYT